jgi:hypothetical protein
MHLPTLLLGLLVAAVSAAARATEPADGAIESCVSTSTIRFGGADQHATLEPDDAEQVRAEMLQRYPVLAQQGFPVTRIVLWLKASGETLFIALLDHPHKAGAACFTATFSASRFDGIAHLRRKYLRPDRMS